MIIAACLCLVVYLVVVPAVTMKIIPGKEVPRSKGRSISQPVDLAALVSRRAAVFVGVIELAQAGRIEVAGRTLMRGDAGEPLPGHFFIRALDERIPDHGTTTLSELQSDIADEWQELLSTLRARGYLVDVWNRTYAAILLALFAAAVVIAVFSGETIVRICFIAAAVLAGLGVLVTAYRIRRIRADPRTDRLRTHLAHRRIRDLRAAKASLVDADAEGGSVTDSPEVPMMAALFGPTTVFELYPELVEEMQAAASDADVYGSSVRQKRALVVINSPARRGDTDLSGFV